MARSLYLAYPEEKPQPGPPDDYQRIQSSPDMFGGRIASAEQQAGGQIHQLGETLLTRYDETASTQAASDYQRQVTDLMYGDQASGQKGYLQMSGQEAMEAAPQIKQKMEALIGQIKGGLKTTGAGVDFERASRRMQAYALEQVGRHYDQSQKIWGISTMETGLSSAERSVATTYNDDDFFKHNLEDAKGFAAKGAQLSGKDPMGAINESQSRLVQARLNGALAQRDYATADQIFKQYGPLLDDQKRLAYSNHIHAGFGDAVGNDMLRDAQGRRVTPASSAGGPDQVENWETRNNNFGGIRKVGVVAGPNAGGFEAYGTPEEGVGAIKRLLTVYQDKHGLNTLTGIINRWAPPNENDTAGLISRASKVTGFAPDQPLDLHDPGTMAKMIEATIRNEQGGKLPVDPGVIQKVAGGAAGAATPAAAAVAPPTGPAPPGMAGLAQAEAELARSHAATVANLTSDPRGAANPTALAHALQKADTEFRSKQMALTAQKQALTEQRNAAADSYVQEMMKGPIDPGILERMRQDGRLDLQTRENLWHAYEAHTKNNAEGDAVKYGAKFFETYSRITAGSDDPNKVRDPAEIYRMAVPKEDGSQDLTLAGADKLVTELKNNKASWGENLQKQRDQLKAAVKPLIDKSNPLMGKIDESGELNLGRFMWDLDQKVKQAIEEKKDPTELLNPNTYAQNPGLLAPYQKSLQQSLKDKTASLSGQGVAAPAPSAGSVGIKPRQPGETVTDYMKRIGGGIAPVMPAPMQPAAPIAPSR
jgi:hypothetical protein